MGFMTELVKLISLIKVLGWGRTWVVLSAFLLLKRAVTFDQVLILLLLNVLVERFVFGGRRPSVRAKHTRRLQARKSRQNWKVRRAGNGETPRSRT
jgi:hypothetical protein